MLTLVAAVDVYERACEGREMVDWLSLLVTVLSLARAWPPGESRNAMSWTREEKDIAGVLEVVTEASCKYLGI
jgi:hypothetical protein